MDVKTNFEVIVVGAGASGLLIAQGLKLVRLSKFPGDTIKGS